MKKEVFDFPTLPRNFRKCLIALRVAVRDGLFHWYFVVLLRKTPKSGPTKTKEPAPYSGTDSLFLRVNRIAFYFLLNIITLPVSGSPYPKIIPFTLSLPRKPAYFNSSGTESRTKPQCRSTFPQPLSILPNVSRDHLPDLNTALSNLYSAIPFFLKTGNRLISKVPFGFITISGGLAFRSSEFRLSSTV